MKRIAAFALLLFLAACTKHYSWNQRITLVVETPQGEVRGTVVQAMEMKYIPEWMRIVPGEVEGDLRGEAVVVDLGEGRYLFALLTSPWWAERIYRDLGSRPEIYRAIERQAGKPPRVLAPEAAPRLVTFGDVSDPTSVMAVDPTDLAATFGEGYALKAVTFGITREAVTEGEVEKVLGWLGPYPEPGLCAPTGRTTDIPFCRRVHEGDFIRRPR